MDNENAARFSQQAYNMLGSGNKEKRVEKINQNIQHTGYTVDYARSNRDVLTLTNGAGRTHVAVRGTDVSGKKTKQDVMADLSFAMGLGSHDAEFKKRRNKVNSIVKGVPKDEHVVLSGHSLGGGVVNHALAKSPVLRKRVNEAHTFNAAAHPVLNDQTKVGRKGKAQLKDKVVHHRTTNDVVSEGFETNLPFGELKRYDTKVSGITKHIPKRLASVFNSVDALHAHKLDHFFD